MSYGYAIMAFISNMYDDDILVGGVYPPYIPIYKGSNLAVGW